MRMRFVISAGLLAFLTLPTAAQEPPRVDQTKLYVSKPEACAAIEQQGAEGIGDGVTLSFADGIEAYEFHCEFFDVKTSDTSPFVLVQAVCEEPGLRFPDLLSVAPFDDTTIEVVSLHDSQTFEPSEENPDPGVAYYTRCDNLGERPRQ